MGRIRDTIIVSDIPSPGALLGTSGSANLIQAINDSFGSASFFGSAQDIYAATSNAFIQNIVKPIQQMGQQVTHLTRSLLNPDEFRPLIELDDFRYVPPCMQLPILMYAPVRQALEEGRVSGYGFDPENLPDEDVYGRLIDNGYVEDVFETCGDNTACDLTWHWKSDDPDLSISEIEAIQETRRRIDYILQETPWDPTDIRTERG